MSDNTFKDLDQVLELTRKRLPIGGQLVEFPDRITAKSGATLILLQRRTAQNPDAVGADPQAYYAGIVGEDAMVEVMTDVLGMPVEEFLPIVGMDGARLLHVVQTLMVWHLAGEDAARDMWNDPGKAKALPTPKPRSKAKGKSGRQGSRGTSQTHA